MTTATPHPAIPLPLVRDPDLLPPLEMDGYLTGVLVTPHLETAQWVMGLWRERSAVDTARIEQGLVTVLAHRKAIEASFAKGWPGFSPAFCEPDQKPDHGKVRTWVRGFWSAMKLAPDYYQLGQNLRVIHLLRQRRHSRVVDFPCLSSLAMHRILV